MKSHFATNSERAWFCVQHGQKHVSRRLIGLRNDYGTTLKLPSLIDETRKNFVPVLIGTRDFDPERVKVVAQLVALRPTGLLDGQVERFSDRKVRHNRFWSLNLVIDAVLIDSFR